MVKGIILKKISQKRRLGKRKIRKRARCGGCLKIPQIRDIRLGLFQSGGLTDGDDRNDGREGTDDLLHDAFGGVVNVDVGFGSMRRSSHTLERKYSYPTWTNKMFVLRGCW